MSIAFWALRIASMCRCYQKGSRKPHKNVSGIIYALLEAPLRAPQSPKLSSRLKGVQRNFAYALPGAGDSSLWKNCSGTLFITLLRRATTKEKKIREHYRSGVSCHDDDIASTRGEHLWKLYSFSPKPHGNDRRRTLNWGLSFRPSPRFRLVHNFSLRYFFQEHPRRQ